MSAGNVCSKAKQEKLGLGYVEDLYLTFPVRFCCRSKDLVSMMSDVKEAIRLREKFPDSVVGFDLVGMEDQGPTLEYFLDALLYPSQNGIKLPYFFHAGETGQMNIPFYGNNVIKNIYICSAGLHNLQMSQLHKWLCLTGETGTNSC